jgi:hypothetical protein
MKIAGIVVLVATLVLTGLLLLLWLVGLIGGIGGSLVHLLLIVAVLILPIGVAVGGGLIAFSTRKRPQAQGS